MADRSDIVALMNIEQLRVEVLRLDSMLDAEARLRACLCDKIKAITEPRIIVHASLPGAVGYVTRG
jgi:hypothetical protein